MRRYDTIWSDHVVVRGTYDFPNVNSNSTVVTDITATGVGLGWALLHWGFDSDATDVDDMQLQFMIIADDLIRVTLTNPTGGAINPGSIDMFFVAGRLNPDI